MLVTIVVATAATVLSGLGLIVFGYMRFSGTTEMLIRKALGDEDLTVNQRETLMRKLERRRNGCPGSLVEDLDVALSYLKSPAAQQFKAATSTTHHTSAPTGTTRETAFQ